jgi:hypothetical protein
MKLRLLSAPDIVILVYQAIVAALILATWSRHDHPAAYLLINLGLMAGTVGFALLESRLPSKVTTFLHAWWPVIVVPISFKQIAWVAPGVQPFGNEAWDRKLQNLDERIFGDTRGFFRAVAWGPAADLLTIGYWSYFLLPIVLGAALYVPSDLRKFREATTVMLVGWFVSYLGYFAVPAVGPHHAVDGPRAAGFEGLWARLPRSRAISPTLSRAATRSWRCSWWSWPGGSTDVSSGGFSPSRRGSSSRRCTCGTTTSSTCSCRSFSWCHAWRWGARSTRSGRASFQFPASRFQFPTFRASSRPNRIEPVRALLREFRLSKNKNQESRIRNQASGPKLPASGAGDGEREAGSYALGGGVGSDRVSPAPLAGPVGSGPFGGSDGSGSSSVSSKTSFISIPSTRFRSRQ